MADGASGRCSAISASVVVVAGVELDAVDPVVGQVEHGRGNPVRRAGEPGDAQRPGSVEAPDDVVVTARDR